VTLVMDWYPEAEQGGFFQAAAKGFYKEVGLDATIVPGGPNTHPYVDLAVGHAQFAIATSDDVIEQSQQGIPFYIVGVFMERYPEGIMVHDGSPVHSFRDLDGRTIIAVPGTGWISYVEQKYGITFSVIPEQFELARFMGNPDAIQQVYLTNEPYYVKKNGVLARILKISDTGYDPYRVIITTKAYAKAHPDAVRAFVAASNRGWSDMIAGDPTPARAMVLALNPQITGDYFDAVIDILRDDHLVDGRTDQGERVGKLSLERLQEEIDLLARVKFIKSSFPVSQVATSDFLQ